MIMFKLLLLIAFIVFVFGIGYGVQWIFRKIDKMAITDKKAEIEHKADLVDDVEAYALRNSGKIRKSQSDAVKEFQDI